MSRSFFARHAAAPLAALLLAVFAAPASAVLITFEELGPKTCCFGGEPPLTNQYAGLGVNFDGAWAVLNQSGNFGLNAFSGEHFAAFNTGAGTTDTLVMDFDQAIDSVGAQIGGGGAIDWIVRWFANNVEIGSSAVASLGGQYAGFSLNLANTGATRVTVQASNAGFGVLDDLQFTAGNAPPVPEPASGLLVLGALAVVGRLSGRKAKA